MKGVVLENLAETVTFLFELVAMTALTALGLLAEHAGILRFTEGFDPLTGWYLLVGAVALYAGVYMLGYQRLFGRVVTAVR